MDDLVEGIRRLLGADFFGSMNIGNPEEVTILELAERVSSLVWNGSEIVFAERPKDDPEVRCPDISLARELLRWEPNVSLTEGLTKTIEWARRLGPKYDQHVPVLTPTWLGFEARSRG